MILFVYGTLRRSVAHPMHEVLRENASPLGRARVRGVLVRVAIYPGLVLDGRAGWVLGELYRLRDPRVLEQLDAYEGVGPLDPEPREYRRVRALVQQVRDEGEGGDGRDGEGRCEGKGEDGRKGDGCEGDGREGDGREAAHEAWVYEYARPIIGLPIIASGDFLRPEG
jgi:gamma-glutamylcyclotransferase (GGCT)/AIG2-like uncharacterized protein YtfP